MAQVGNFHQIHARVANEPGFGTYRTSDTEAEIEAAGYFNDLRGFFKAGDVIELYRMDGNGAPVENSGRTYAVATTPVGGDITIVQIQS